MFLTCVKRSAPRDPTAFPTAQLALLALVRVAEPIALTSILPYAWKLTLDFHVGDESNASFYSGLLISAFALAESLTGMWWGGVSDRWGRKPVLLFGCFGTILSLLIVGLAPNFWVALFGRALGGLLNGNIGVVQTMVGELVTLPQHQPRAYAVMPFVWSIGTILGPAIGALGTADQCNNGAGDGTKSLEVCSPNGVFGRFPYLFPNLICSCLLFVAIVAGAFLIEETHPDMQPWSDPLNLASSSAETPLLATAGAIEHAPSDLRNESYGTFNAVDVQDPPKFVTASGRAVSVPEVARPGILSKRIVMLIVALGIFTYHAMTYDALISIFLEDARTGSTFSVLSADSALAGGLGMSIKEVGGILAVNGIIALFVQGVIFPLAASRLGVWKLFVLATLGHPLAYFIVPYLVLLPAKGLYAGIYACLSVRNLFSIIAYPVLLILLKEASPGPSYLGKINGLAASTGAACRTLACPIAGYLYGVGIRINFTPLAWWVSAFVALVGAIQMFFIGRQKKETAQVRTVALFTDEKAGDLGEVVHFIVEEASDSDYSDEEQGQRDP